MVLRSSTLLISGPLVQEKALSFAKSLKKDGFKASNGWLNKLKNGSRGTKPTYLFMVIIPLLVMELKATPNGNPSNNFCWRQKSSTLNVVQYNTTSRPIIIHLQIYIA